VDAMVCILTSCTI